MTNATQTKPADITLKQLGGSGRLTAMIGAKHFLSADNGKTLRFRWTAKSQNKANYIAITLNDLDLYDIEFGRVHGNKYTKKSIHKMIPVENLRLTFEETTGLFLSI